MKFILLPTFLTMFYFMSIAQELKTKLDSISYSAGVVLAQKLKKQGFKNLSSELLSQSISDVLKNQDLSIKLKDADRLFKQVVTNLKIEMKEAVKNEGEAFLLKNAKKLEVITLPSGLQYEILNEGYGPSPLATNEVTTHYHGTLITGEVFDSSVERGNPLSFPIKRVIKAWQEALQLMKIGSKWRIYSPYSLAYGAHGAGAKIPPYSALIFDIELLSIE